MLRLKPSVMTQNLHSDINKFLFSLPHTDAGRGVLNRPQLPGQLNCPGLYKREKGGLTLKRSGVDLSLVVVDRIVQQCR